jgi:uncharacterized protein with HEPN domain
VPAASDLDRAQYLVDLIETVRSEIEGYSRATFLADRQTRDLTAYRLGTIGETAGRLSQTLKNQHPEIPWKAIYAFRHIVVHDYGSVDFDRVWDIASEDLATLASTCEALLIALRLNQ